MKVTFTISGRPVPWKRLRTNGKTRFPAKGQEEAKDAIREAFRSNFPSGRFITTSHAVDMTIHAVFALPQKMRRDDPRQMGSPHTFTPDADNIGKLVKDALNGIAYGDDRVVSCLTIKKQWSDHDRTTVTLEYHPVERAEAQLS